MREKYKFGVGFWSGAGIYSLINMMMNLTKITQPKVLNYNYIITAAAVIGFILSLYLLKKSKQKEL